MLPKCLHLRPVVVSLLTGFVLGNAAQAVEWKCSWTPSAGEKASATVTPMKYGKLWGYAIEIDDGGTETGVFAPDFFAPYRFTDAPPGVSGGKEMPVVGSLALVAGGIGRNSASLDEQQVLDAIKKGWAITSHSYAHRGRTYGNPPEILTPEELREDLYWSQVVFANLDPSGRAPTHFVYPNGYRDYSNYLAEFGLVSGSLVGGSSYPNILAKGVDPKFLGRAYLDEGAWKSDGGSPMKSFSDKGPNGSPEEGTVNIDFTHGIDIKPESENQQRWKQRLETITGKYGAKGTDEFWCAPAQELINYALAAKVAVVKSEPGKLSVSIPDNIPGTPLTVRLDGIPASTKIPAPAGTLVYRKENTVWITTPTLGVAGAPSPSPKVKRVFTGPAKAVLPLDKPVKIAAVRVKVAGKSNGEPIKVDLVAPNGSTVPLGEKKDEAERWVFGQQLYATVPNKPAVLAKEVHVSMTPLVRDVEIWALDE